MTAITTLEVITQTLSGLRLRRLSSAPRTGDALARYGRRLTPRGLLLGRKRYWRAALTLAEVATLYTRQHLTHKPRQLEQVHTEAGQKLAKLARRNGGVWVKAAQFFSTRADVLPAGWINGLQTLQNDAAPISFHQIEGMLELSLGSNWCGYFDWIEVTPIATASIAQLHKAKLKDGPEVALKVQLPGVKESFLQDMASFRLLAKWANPLVKELDVVQIVECLVKMTRDELDFRHEASNLQAFSQLPHPAYIRVPDLYDSLSREGLLVTSWEEGKRLREHLDEAPNDAPQLLNLLLGSYLQIGRAHV